MRKVLLALSILVFLCPPLRSGGNSDVDIVMSIEDLSVTLVQGSLDITFDVNDNLVEDKAAVQNTGNVDEDYQVYVSSQGHPPNWTLITDTSTLGHDDYRLRAIWHENDIKPSTSEYQANDILSTAPVTSSDTQFFNEFDTHTVSGFKGYGTVPGQYSNLYIWVEGPPTGSQSGPMTNKIAVTAVATP